MDNMICNRVDKIEQCLVPYINRPVYVKGYCWNKSFDGWTVVYEGEKSKLVGRNLLFDYRGKTYQVYGFLPSRYTLSTSPSYNNAFYDPKLINQSNKIVKQEAEKYNNGWISVKERLPEKAGSYLVIGKTGGAVVTRWYEPSKFYPNGHFGG